MAESKPIPKEQKIFLGVLALVGLYMFYGKVWKPQGALIKELKENIEKTNKDIILIKGKIAKMKQIEAEFVRLQGEMAEAEKKLPKLEELPELIREITATGSGHGIEIDNLNIASVATKQSYKEHNYRFSITASYHKIAQFFTDICQKERIMTVKNLNLAPSGGPEGISEMRATFTLVVYTYKE